MITIFKGDDTGGALGKHIFLDIQTQYDLTGCTVIFNYQGVERRLTDVKDGDRREIIFSHNETAKMAVGTFKAVVIAVDSSGKVRTLTNTLPIKVSTDLADSYDENIALVRIGKTISWANIGNLPFEGQEVDISTDDRELAALGTIIEKLGGTVKASIALLALCAATAFGYTPEAHTNSYERDGVTYAQRGGLGAADYVVTNIDTEAVVKVKSVNGKDGEVVLDYADVGALPDDEELLKVDSDFRRAVEAVSPPFPEKIALASVTNSTGGAVQAADVNALPANDDYYAIAAESDWFSFDAWNDYGSGVGMYLDRDTADIYAYNENGSGADYGAEDVIISTPSNSATLKFPTGEDGTFATREWYNDTFEAWRSDFGSRFVGSSRCADWLGGSGSHNIAFFQWDENALRWYWWDSNHTSHKMVANLDDIATRLPDDLEVLKTNENFKAAVEAVSPPVELPAKWALANVTNASGNAVTAGDVGALSKSGGTADDDAKYTLFGNVKLEGERDKTEVEGGRIYVDVAPSMMSTVPRPSAEMTGEGLAFKRFPTRFVTNVTEYGISQIKRTVYGEDVTVELPQSGGTLALTSDIPDGMPTTGLVWNATAGKVKTADGAKTIGAADVGAISNAKGVDVKHFESFDAPYYSGDALVAEGPYSKTAIYEGNIELYSNPNFDDVVDIVFDPFGINYSIRASGDTEYYHYYYPYRSGTLAVESYQSLSTMLTDANTNQTADCECISTNICKLIAPHIEPVKVLLNIYDNALEANWAFSIVNGDMKYACTTNEDITAFQKANPVLTDKQTADDYRVIVTGGEMKFFTDQQ